MTQEEKQLLLKGLCARLPYGVKINIYDDYSGMMKDEELNIFHLDSTYNIEYRNLRPYLRPMSSMTEDEKIERLHLIKEVKKYFWIDKLLDFYLSHHLDYRGLIPMGLAIEAQEGMYKTE